MTELIAFDANLPAHLQGAVAADDNNALITQGGPSFPMITLKGREFSLKVDGETKSMKLFELSLIIVATTPNSSHTSKTFYKGAWVDGSDEAPDCSSSDGIRPDDNVENKQSLSCATCPQAAWGSVITEAGKKAKACSDNKMLYLLAPDDLGGKLVAMRVPTMSLRHLTAYARQLSHHNVPASACKVVISFVEGKSYPEIEFKFGGYLSADDYEVVKNRVASDEVQQILKGEIYATEDDSAGKAVPTPTVATLPDAPDHVAEVVGGDMFKDPEPAAQAPQTEIEKLQAQIAALKNPEPEPTPEEMEIERLRAKMAELEMAEIEKVEAAKTPAELKAEAAEITASLEAERVREGERVAAEAAKVEAATAAAEAAAEVRRVEAAKVAAELEAGAAKTPAELEIEALKAQLAAASRPINFEDELAANAAANAAALKAQLAAASRPGATPPAATTVDVDITGRVWDERVDSSNKKTVAATGKWSRRRNLDDAYYNSMVAELVGTPAPLEATSPPVTTGRSLFEEPSAGATVTETKATAPATEDTGGIDDLLSKWGAS